MKVLTFLLITFFIVIALALFYKSLQNPVSNSTESSAYQLCITQATSEYDETMVYLQSVEKDCLSKGLCNPTDQKWLDAKATGEQKVFDELKKQQEICQIKFSN